MVLSSSKDTATKTALSIYTNIDVAEDRSEGLKSVLARRYKCSRAVTIFQNIGATELTGKLATAISGILGVLVRSTICKACM